MARHGYNHIENEAAYDRAVAERIKANARKGRERRWLAEDATRADLAADIRTKGYDRPNSFWAKMATALEEWGALTAGQEAACRKILADDGAKREARRAAEAGSQAVGTVGTREVFEGLTLLSVFTNETAFGTQFVFKFRDQAGNVLVWKASGSADHGDMTKGDTYTLKATVKTHWTRNDGSVQTYLTRAKVQS